MEATIVDSLVATGDPPSTDAHARFVGFDVMEAMTHCRATERVQRNLGEHRLTLTVEEFPNGCPLRDAQYIMAGYVGSVVQSGPL
jgi:hypothetical protein